MSKSAMGIAITTVSTSQLLPLGFIYVEPATNDGQGEKHWVYVYNDEAATAFAVGDIVVRDTVTGTHDGILMASGTEYPAMRVLGVAQHAIAAGSYGFIQCKGVCLVKNGTANITGDAAITTGGDRAGAAIDFADGAEECVFGLALESEATDNTTFDAWINCPGA